MCFYYTVNGRSIHAYPHVTAQDICAESMSIVSGKSCAEMMAFLHEMMSICAEMIKHHFKMTQEGCMSRHRGYILIYDQYTRDVLSVFSGVGWGYKGMLNGLYARNMFAPKSQIKHVKLTYQILEN